MKNLYKFENMEEPGKASLNPKDLDIREFRLSQRNNTNKTHKTDSNSSSFMEHLEARMQKIKGFDNTSLNCEDIIYAIIDEALRKIEPVIIRCDREAHSIRNLSFQLSHLEKSDYIRRIHMAKEDMLKFNMDLNQLKDFYVEIQEKAFQTSRNQLLVKFLQGRLQNCSYMLEKAIIMLNVSKKTYNTIVEESMLAYQNRVNDIMLALTIFTIMFMPFTVISGLFGMNVRVPWQGEDNTLAFFMILLCMFLMSMIFLIAFRKLRWL